MLEGGFQSGESWKLVTSGNSHKSRWPHLQLQNKYLALVTEKNKQIYQSAESCVFTEEKRSVIVTGETLHLGMEAQSADLP